MAAMRRTYLTLLVVVALFGLGVVTSCVVRNGRGRGAYPVSKAHHKHEKGPKKHKH